MGEDVRPFPRSGVGNLHCTNVDGHVGQTIQLRRLGLLAKAHLGQLP